MIYLTVFHRLFSTAQTIITEPLITPSLSLVTKTLITASPCITITSLVAPTGCKIPTICPEIACPFRITTSVLPCGCPSPVPTVYKTTSCGCPGCGPIHTSILPPRCETTACPTVTETAAPGCPISSPISFGCVTPDCILLSTLPIPCGCTGIHTVTSCNGKCPQGCGTWYTGLSLPCPLTSVIAS